MKDNKSAYIDFDVKFLYITNNIAENINKILNSHFKYKYPLFDDWRNALLHTSSLINLNKEPIDRKYIVSNILMYFMNNFKNKDILSTNLLTNEDIKKLNTFLIPGSNMRNYIAISKYFNI